MPNDPLYDRYMAAHRELRTHLRGCSSCADDDLCPDGARFFRALAVLQDQHLARQKHQRP
ncbi:hypothetical protein AB0G74_16750 [Streptomyces sp. NPDC020875]|uniref:hypothetical protein n=1 Tax=Streptomyces sp. NPDC020875 TaxID=3154898 RepID=UPI0033CDADCA